MPTGPSRGGAAPRAAAALPLLTCLLLLGACATQRLPDTVLPPAEQAQLLRQLQDFRLEGRIGGRAGDESIGPASLDWRQRGEAGSLRMAGVFGLGSMRVEWQADALRITAGRNEVYEGAEAEALLQQQLGFVPPFDSLRYWVLGLHAPGDEPAGEADAGGRLSEFTQHDWQVSIDRWMKVRAGSSGVELPQRVTLTRGELRVRVFVERWKL